MLTVKCFAAIFAVLTMQNIAHRGMWDMDVPQNTVEAIKRAYDAGATWVETDFHCTKAGLEFRMWGVNSVDDLRRARDLGAVGFTCNHWLKAFDWANEIGGVTLLK